MPEPRSSESPKPLSWSEWKAQNGSKRWYCRLPLAVEWALEWFVYHLRSLALFDLLELLGKLTVLIAVIFWFLEADNRAKERHYRAWELINAARGSTGDGGRIDALQDLNKDHVSLIRAPLEKAWLFGIDLKDAELYGANLQEAYLMGANLQDAALKGANLTSANLTGANLQGANLTGANLLGANLTSATLKGAYLYVADPQGARPLTHPERAALGFAYLQVVDQHFADLHANLRGANLLAADLQGANLLGARNLTQEQLDVANGDDRTVLPDGLTRPAHWKAKGRKSPPR